MRRSRLLQNKPTLVASAIMRLADILTRLVERLPIGKVIRDTRDTQVPIDLSLWFWQRVIGINCGAYWPMHRTSKVSYPRRVIAGIETSPGWSRGCYIHAINGIYIGDYTQIAPNVGLISGNHDLYDLSRQVPAPPIRIGKYCLLGMGSVILPGVELGDYTIVGSNAVVTHSFPEGHVILGGVPAMVIGKLDRTIERHYVPAKKYNGYIPHEQFAEFVREQIECL